MTERNEWKPVAHKPGCACTVLASWKTGDVQVKRPECECSCTGTRWSGYGERVGDCAAVWALCEWFGKMRQDERLSGRLHVWDYENPEEGSWDKIEEFLHDTTPGVGDCVRLALAKPLADVEVEMLAVGEYGEPVSWVIRDVKTGAMLAASRREVGGLNYETP